MNTTSAGRGDGAALPHLLVVDDDLGLCELLQRYLGENGYRVSTVGDGVAMDAFLREQEPDLIVLDLMLPGEDGLTLARRLRQQGNRPILMLSARGEEIDRILGLEMGADDYLPKPFNPRELLARIKALLRRAQPVETPAPATRVTSYHFDRFRLDLEGQALYADDARIAITGGEFALLRILLEHPGQVLSRDDLVQELKGYERQPYDRSVDVRVTRLRKKIEPDPSSPVFIRTVWSRGYLFTPGGNAGANPGAPLAGGVAPAIPAGIAAASR